MAIHLDGTANYLRTANLPVLNGPWSYVLWFYPTGWPSAGTSDFLTYNVKPGTQVQQGIVVHTLADGVTHRLGLVLSDDPVLVTGSIELQLNTWYHLFVVRGAVLGRSDVYLNGSLDIQKTLTATENSTHMYVGAEFVGRLAHFRWWADTLTTTQAAAESRSTSHVRTANLEGAYELVDTSSDENDTSGLSRPFTVNGTPTTAEGPPMGRIVMNLMIG